MASAKPDLSTASNVQNVVVYVSNDNFAQAYAVNPQNVPHSQQNLHHGSGYAGPNHSMASLVKNISEKQPQQIVNTSQGGYFANVISQSSFQQPIVNNAGFQNVHNGAVLKNYLNNDVLSSKVREECDINRENNYIEQPYVILGSEITPHNVRCDSVRSETAESSCSSLSSGEEGMLVVQNRSPENSNNMVVYDPSVSVRQSGVVLTAVGPPLGPNQTNMGPSIGSQHSVVGPPILPHQVAVGPPVGSHHVLHNQNILVAPSVQSPQFITVPDGWKRHLNNGSVIYISPSNTALSSPEQVKEYLLSNGTCKCGLECHFKYENTFSFDPKVIGKPWVLSPDTNTGDLTKLCNHKRKILAVASLDCKPSDPNSKLRKEFNVKRKKRKIGLPYAPGVSVSQILAHRDKLSLNQPITQPQGFNDKNAGGPSQQLWPQGAVSNAHLLSNRLQGYGESPQNQLVRCQDQLGNRMISGSPTMLGENTMMVQHPSKPSNPNTSNQHIQQNQSVPQNSSHILSQQIIGPNGQLINVQSSLHGNQNTMPNNQGLVIQGQTEQLHLHQNRLFVNSQPNEPSGPGRPNVQMIPVSITNHQIVRPETQQRMQQPQFYSNPQHYHQIDSSKTIRPVVNGYRPQIMHNPMQPNKMHWHNRLQQQNIVQQHQLPVNPHSSQANNQNMTPNNIYERVPPLHQHTPSPIWQEEIRRKKVKVNKVVKSRSYGMEDCPINHAPCPNIDVRQIPTENNRTVIINQMPHSHSASSPSFMEDPSGYLAQQTALLNNTINRQTGANCNSYIYNSTPAAHQNIIAISQANEVPLPSNLVINNKPQCQMSRASHNVSVLNKQQQQQISQGILMSQQQFNQVQQQHHLQQEQQQHTADSSGSHDNQQHYTSCQGCITDHNNRYVNRKAKTFSRSGSEPGTPNSSCTSEDPVTSSVYTDKHSNQSSPDTRPIQGGTVSTSNVSPVDGGHSNPSTPNPQTPTPTHRSSDPSHASSLTVQQNLTSQQLVNQSREATSTSVNYINQLKQDSCCPYPHVSRLTEMPYISGVVTTMASGRTVGSNTITSVVAGRANTATVSINSPGGQSLSGSSTPTSANVAVTAPTQAITVSVSKSPLEMVQSVVSSIQVPYSQHQQHHQQQQLQHHQQEHQHNIMSTVSQPNSQISPQIIKHSPTGLPSGHIFVSSGGQLIMASTGNHGNVMAPPPPKLITSQNAMPPISVSPMVTNVTGAMTQVIPAVAQQVLGQQTVLVNALPAPFVLQPGVTMSMDGMTVGQNMQLPQLVTGNLVQQQIHLDNSDPRRTQGLLSPESKKKGKKRKMSQTVAGMLHIAAQQNSGVVMSQQGFPQQIQMAHSPQGPVMQALTIVPSKNGGPAQIVMNGQAMTNTNIGSQQLITNSPTQQINLLQPVNLINGATGVVQNFPIQQFIVPNIGGSMVMNPDGTATILQDTSNLGMQLQIQNVNGQNVLTPIQNNNMFNGGQSILAAGPAGMVIRAPTSQGKIIQQQQHSPGAQFLSPGGGQFVVNGQFNGQLSPLVASVSPSQQVTFSTSPQQIRSNNSLQPAQQEYIQMNGQVGQTLMVPCNPQPANIAVSSSNQNTTYVQQNTTIVQQQTTMVSNNQQMQNYQQNNQQNQQNMDRTATLNLDQQNFIISSNENKQLQAVVLQQQQREGAQNSANYRQSVSTQTAVNQNTQAVTTNTFCQTSALSTGSLPDTTTLSPLACGGQSPPTADTTTHSGSTDDALSPAPSNCSATCSDNVGQGRSQSCTMAMVHCISSSEPDSAEVNINTSESEWRRNRAMSSTPKSEYIEISSPHMTYINKKSTPTHVAFAESSTMGMQFFNEKIKCQSQQDVDSRNIRKMILNHRKSSDNMVVLESRHMHSSLFDDDEVVVKDEKEMHNFDMGDLIWGPTKGCPAWPGKIIEMEDECVTVKWFGNEKHVSNIQIGDLQTLTEGLDAHHQARKKSRTSRKLNSQLEKAIQEAMAELDKKSTYVEAESPKRTKISPKELTLQSTVKKNSSRLKNQR